MKSQELITKFKLPGYTAGLSFADASKKIDSKFKDRNDMISKRTKEELLNRLSQAQEYAKAREEQAQVPQGQMMADGGFYDNNNPYFMENPGEQSVPAIAGPENGTFMQRNAGAVGNVMGGAQMAASKGLLGAGAQSAMGAAGSGLGVLGAAQGAMALNDLAKGNGASRSKLGGAAQGAMTGVMAGSAFGPAGMIAGGAVGAIAGGIGSGKRREQDAEIGSHNAKMANDVFRDKRYAALGGPLPINNPLKKIVGDVYGSFNPSEGTITDGDFTNDLVAQRNASLSGNSGTSGPITQPNYYDNNKPFFTTDVANPAPAARQQGPGFLSKAGNFIKNNIGSESLRYAPVLVDMLQLGKLKGPTHESTPRLTNTYQPQFMDEATIQNSIGAENRNTINALTNASGGSSAGLRAGILGANLNATKARSDAYIKMKEYNNNQNVAKQQFQLGIDQTNLAQANMENDINARNRDNYETQKSKFISNIGSTIGEIGKEQLFKKYPKMMALGYDWNGKYFINSKTGDTKTEAEASSLETTAKKAKGGFLSGKSITYINSLNKK